MVRILITGIDGLLGQALAEQFSGRHQLTGIGRNPAPSTAYQALPADITDPDSLVLIASKLQPDIVINTAAMTAVDTCEDRPDDARKANAEGVQNLIQAFPRAKLVQLSTDYVFDGTAGPYREDDTPNPLGVYAKTKFEGERIALGTPDSLVIRTTILYGDKPGMHGKKDFVSYAVDQLEQGKDVRAVNDQVGTPTHVRVLAQAIDHLLQRGATGIYNVAGRELVSRADFSRAIARAFGFDPARITEVTTADLKQKAPRPLKAGLRLDKLVATGFRMPPLEQCLDEAWMSYRGIRVKECASHPTRDAHGRENGLVIPILSRTEDPGFVQDGQFSHYYLTIANPGTIKGWHMHSKKTGHFFVADGFAKLVLYDGRRFKELLLGREDGIEQNRVVRIPPGITAAFKATGRRPAIVVNYSTPPYDPDDRGEMTTTDIAYDWG